MHWNFSSVNSYKDEESAKFFVVKFKVVIICGTGNYAEVDH
jgi:hypothetical protein